MEFVWGVVKGCIKQFEYIKGSRFDSFVKSPRVRGKLIFITPVYWVSLTFFGTPSMAILGTGRAGKSPDRIVVGHPLFPS